MDIQSALTYYRHVKMRIGHSEELWSEFKDIMKACRAEKIEPHRIIIKIAKLFQSYPELISGFQNFLPNCYKQHLKAHYEKFKESRNALSSQAAIENQTSLEVTYEDFIGDESVSSVAAYGSFEDLHFFEKVRNAMGHEQVYYNFLHCLELYIDDHLTKSELLKAVNPFLIKYPDLIREFKQMLGINESGDVIEFVPHKIACSVKEEDDIALDVDYCSGKRLNASYRPLPKSHPQPVCSGRTQMCKEVLNDTWVSFPAWSEDSTFGASSKTKYEETMYRIEDERFELDMAIQTNAYAIEVLNNVQRRINKMTEVEKGEFVLDDYLGGTSSVLNYRFIHRIYGNRTKELMEGLKRNPVVAVPIVLNRLRVREREWKEVQERYNATWSEQIGRIYLKSLDHQGLNFKQNDAKNLRPKTLMNEIETFYEEKKQVLIEGSVGNVIKPHIVVYFKDLDVFTDALNLILRDIKRQPGIYRDDQRHIFDLICFFVVGFFNVLPDLMSSCKIGQSKPRNIINSDSDEENSAENVASENEELEPQSEEENSSGDEAKRDFQSDVDQKLNIKMSERFAGNYQFWKDEECFVPYSLFYVNNNWYIFFRLFSILVDRLASLYICSSTLVEKVKKEPGALDLLDDKPLPYYTLLGKVAHLLTGKLESSKFEDEMRELFGVQAYVSYTLDKVVHAIVKQLHIISTDDVSKQCMAYHISHILTFKKVTCPWMLSDIEEKYKKKIRSAVDDENCYKIVWYKKKKLLAMELLDPVQDVATTFDIGLPNYLDRYVQEEALINDMPFSAYPQLPVIHRRVLRKQHKIWANILRKEMEAYSKQVSQPKFCIKGLIIQNKGAKRRRECEDDITPISKKTKSPTLCDETSSLIPSETSLAMEECTSCFDDKDIEEVSNKEMFLTEASEDEQDDDSVMETDEMGENALMSIANEDGIEKSGKSSPLQEEMKDNKGINAEMDSNISEEIEPSANEEDEESINVSAEDLLFHLSQTGMGMFDCFSGSRTTSDTKADSSQSAEPKEMPKIESRNDDHNYELPSNCRPEFPKHNDVQSYGENDQSSSDNDQSSGENDQSSDENDQSSGENDQSSCENDQSSGENDQSSGENDQSSGENDHSSCENDASSGGNNQSPAGNSQSPAENSQSPAENDISPAANDFSPAANDLSPAANDLSSAENDLSSAENNLYPAENDLYPAEKDLHPAENDLSPAEKDLSPAENYLSPAENYLSPAENYLSPAEKNLSPAENDQSSTEKDQSPAENSQSPVENGTLNCLKEAVIDEAPVSSQELQYEEDGESSIASENESSGDESSQPEEKDSKKSDNSTSTSGDSESSASDDDGGSDIREDEEEENQEEEGDGEDEKENYDPKEEEHENLEEEENGDGEGNDEEEEDNEENGDEEQENGEEEKENDGEEEDNADDEDNGDEEDEDGETKVSDDKESNEEGNDNSKEKTSLSRKKNQVLSKNENAADNNGEEMIVDQKEDTSDDSDADSEEPLEYRPTLFPEFYPTGVLQDYLNMACKEMIIVENPVHVFDNGTCKLRFTATFRDFICRRKCLQKARKAHLKISVRKSSIFNNWHKSWLQQNVSAAMMKSCYDWLVRCDPEKYRVDCITINDRTKPPYAPYSKYLVRRYKRC